MTSMTRSTFGALTSMTRRSFSRRPLNSGGWTSREKSKEGASARARVTASENLAGWAVERTIWTVEGGLGRDVVSTVILHNVVAGRTYFVFASTRAACMPTAVCGSTMYEGLPLKYERIVSRVCITERS